MNIPTIGGPRGIFEIFVPGVFLLLNAVAAIYFSPFIDAPTREFLIKNLAPNAALVLVVTICFGYLIGVLLRLSRTSKLDSLSAKWLKRFTRGARKKDGTFQLFASEEFPYIGWIGEACERRLPPKALDFYNKTWGDPLKQGEKNDRFFNFCKDLINSVDERSANEIYIAEALSRYMLGMFYALRISACLMLLDVCASLLVFRAITPAVWLALPVLIYLWAIGLILRHFRMIRVKEVETVFDATFVNREKLEALLTSQVEEPQGPKRRRLSTLRRRPARSARPHRS